MAGTISLNLTQQLDEFGKPLSGGKLYIIQAGTVATPQNAYQDSALTLALANPIILDASGRLPQFFLADGSIKIRLTDLNGTEKLVADGLIVTGASSGGGGGSAVDATTVLQTGDFKINYGTGVLSGFVRANGRTLGNATSGATERANADTVALFAWLYNDTNLAVLGGRGASAAADYAASKTIVIPDIRGRALAGLDDMGNTAAGRLSATYFGTAATVLGAAGGAESQTLTLTQLPSITSSVPGLSIPGLSIPGLSIPGLSIPGLSVPSLTVTTTTDSLGGSSRLPISSSAVSSLQTQGAATANITPNNSNGFWSIRLRLRCYSQRYI